MSGERGRSWRPARVGVFALALCVLFAPGCKRSAQALRDSAMKRGERYVEKKDYQRAILEFQNASSQAPKAADTASVTGPMTSCSARYSAHRARIHEPYGIDGQSG